MIPAATQQRLADLAARHPAPHPRATAHQWRPHAWLVRGLVEAGHGVTAACRIVADEEDLAPRAAAVNGLRQGYYKIRHEQWPTNVLGD